jgi:heme/copper-type cytochrome/quinol oxidase subunit 2
MTAIIGLVLFGVVLFALYNAIRFCWTVARKHQDNRYGRRMIYSVVLALVMVLAITQM